MLTPSHNKENETTVDNNKIIRLRLKTQKHLSDIAVYTIIIIVISIGMYTQQCN